jgi:undecaprenyl-diphosphatase
MTLFQAIVLGLVQGLAEFLPVSSSAHLTLVPWFFGWQDPGLSFDVALHFGTLLALLWYFRRDWIALLAAAWMIVLKRRIETVEERRVLYLVLATIPGAIGGLLLQDYAETTFRAPALTATMLMIMGVLLWAADRFAPQVRDLSSMRAKDAIMIGVAQVFALVPGVSRSGSTITAGRALAFDRVSAARFSFLMSMPITAAAVVLKMPHAVKTYGVTTPFIVGIATAAVSSLFAISVLLRYVSRHSFGVFAAYRLLLGIAVFIVLAVRG